jgi:hypothetical protein
MRGDCSAGAAPSDVRDDACKPSAEQGNIRRSQNPIFCNGLFQNALAMDRPRHFEPTRSRLDSRLAPL